MEAATRKACILLASARGGVVAETNEQKREKVDFEKQTDSRQLTPHEVTPHDAYIQN